jgi:pimeloyl-ACP methyl ester carboxylesterase
LVYDRRGAGAPLVLIHGIGSRWQVWEPVLDQIAMQRDVISIDLPGFGASPADPAVAIGVRGYAHRVAELIDELRLGAVEVGGNSMGGGIALELGRMGVAGRVTAISPVGFWSRAERRWCQLYFTGARALATRIRPRLPSIVARPFGRVALGGVLIGHPSRMAPATIMANIDGMLDAPSFEDALTSFGDYDIRDPAQDWGKLPDIPVTVAWGNRDALLIYKTQSARARTVLPWAQHVTLRSCGHVPFYDDPAQCARVLLTQPGGMA